jgi:hypothetical protein
MEDFFHEYYEFNVRANYEKILSKDENYYALGAMDPMSGSHLDAVNQLSLDFLHLIKSSINDSVQAISVAASYTSLVL